MKFTQNKGNKGFPKYSADQAENSMDDGAQIQSSLHVALH